jgi:hypothetical protein
MKTLQLFFVQKAEIGSLFDILYLQQTRVCDIIILWLFKKEGKY